MAPRRMRLSPAKLLIVVAFCIVVLVELRTVLAFFGVDVAVGPTVVVGAVVVATVVLWAVLPVLRESDE